MNGNDCHEAWTALSEGEQQALIAKVKGFVPERDRRAVTSWGECCEGCRTQAKAMKAAAIASMGFLDPATESAIEIVTRQCLDACNEVWPRAGEDQPHNSRI